MPAHLFPALPESVEDQGGTGSGLGLTTHAHGLKALRKACLGTANDIAMPSGDLGTSQDLTLSVPSCENISDPESYSIPG